MKRWTPMLMLLALLASPAMGCAVYPGTAREVSLSGLRGEAGWILVDGVPDARQSSAKGCGAACLAMILGHWGMPAMVEDLERECMVSEADGIRAADLRDAARRRGLQSFLVAGTMADLRHELGLGRPVLVGLAKPHGEGYTAHFQVVIGIQPVEQRIAVMDPTVGPMSDSLRGFEVEWRIAKCVMVVFLPGEVMVAAPEGTKDGSSSGGER